MTVSLFDLMESDGPADPEMQERTLQSPAGPRTRQYLARCGGREIAFVAIDRLPERDCLSLYELFVPRGLRGRGIGSSVLEAVERMAISEGFGAVRLHPTPLDPSVTQTNLEKWYRDRGYCPVSEVPGELEKRLGSNPSAK